MHKLPCLPLLRQKSYYFLRCNFVQKVFLELSIINSVPIILRILAKLYKQNKAKWQIHNTVHNTAYTVHSKLALHHDHTDVKVFDLIFFNSFRTNRKYTKLIRFWPNFSNRTDFLFVWICLIHSVYLWRNQIKTIFTV
jgi:hypothetical protein